jgi:hypothetical protein
MTAIGNQNKTQVELGREFLYQATQSHSDGLKALVNQKIDDIRDEWQIQTTQIDAKHSGDVKAAFAQFEKRQITDLARGISKLIGPDDSNQVTQCLDAFLQNKLKVTQTHRENHKLKRQDYEEDTEIDETASPESREVCETAQARLAHMDRFTADASPRIVKLFYKILNDEMRNLSEKNEFIAYKKSASEAHAKRIL